MLVGIRIRINRDLMQSQILKQLKVIQELSMSTLYYHAGSSQSSLVLTAFLNSFFSSAVIVSALAMTGITVTLDDSSCNVLISNSFMLYTHTSAIHSSMSLFPFLPVTSGRNKVQTSVYTSVLDDTTKSNMFLGFIERFILLINVFQNRMHAICDVRSCLLSYHPIPAGYLLLISIQSITKSRGIDETKM